MIEKPRPGALGHIFRPGREGETLRAECPGKRAHADRQQRRQQEGSDRRYRRHQQEVQRRIRRTLLRRNRLEILKDGKEHRQGGARARPPQNSKPPPYPVIARTPPLLLSSFTLPAQPVFITFHPPTLVSFLS